MAIMKSTVCGGCAGGTAGAAVGYGEARALRAAILEDVNQGTGPEVLDRSEIWRIMQHGAVVVGSTAGATGGALVGSGCILS